MLCLSMIRQNKIPQAISEIMKAQPYILEKIREKNKPWLSKTKTKLLARIFLFWYEMKPQKRLFVW